MSVGAGSIKRAAKAAEGNLGGSTEGSVASKPVETAEAVKASGTVKTAKTVKTSGTAKTAKTVKTSGTAKTSETLKNSKSAKEIGNAAVENKAAGKPGTGSTPYVTYGVGQELPVYLM